MSAGFGSRVRERAGGAGLRLYLALGVVAALVALLAVLLVAPDSTAGQFAAVLFANSTFASALRLSVPIAFAALGGIFAEKSGVINIGLEGLLIIAAFAGIYAADLLGSPWLGLLGGVAASTLFALLFAVVCIEFRADQIIAGLAVWLIALGLAPFAAQVVYGSTNTPRVATFATLPTMGIPVVSEGVTAELLFGYALVDLPFFGALFSATPMVYVMFAAVVASWWTLNRTAFGRHVRASGENPKALDTAGVSVSRVRYAAVLLSGVLCGFGGAALSLSLGQFIGNGPTMVDGKGFIAIVAYLLGNYNAVGALLSTLLFAGLDALQLTLQARDVIQVPNSLVRTIPYVSVIVVLTLFGRTRTPDAAGDHYESGEE
ncbi:ABC transporter permease [Candidatus Halobonum tyrrellensis]|uniref:Ribose ABC transporter permease n=1 Tax=Candidatus Halobonum tyrrellensis G22 TaxID=1324957 RepID=V4GTZ7_9EURY|nr:ribose ABC transporter permease [Candidatus Halobonum tyrrellensis G22]